jgi:hypothetical protein
LENNKTLDTIALADFPAGAKLVRALFQQKTLQSSDERSRPAARAEDGMNHLPVTATVKSTIHSPAGDALCDISCTFVFHDEDTLEYAHSYVESAVSDMLGRLFPGTSVREPHRGMLQ